MEEVSRKNYLDGTSTNMSIMRKPSGKWRSVIKGKCWSILGFLELGLESVDLGPVLEDFFFHLWETRLFEDFKGMSVIGLSLPLAKFVLFVLTT